MNKLKLNLDKGEFPLIKSEQQWSKYLSMFPIKLVGVKSNPAKYARNLRIIVDTNFTFRSHISAACMPCFYHMWDLQRIHLFIDLGKAKLVATDLVSNRLGYCNSLLYGVVVYGIVDSDLYKASTCSESTGPCCGKVISIYSQGSIAAFPSLVTSKYRI